MNNDGHEQDMTEDPYNVTIKRENPTLSNIIISVKNVENLEEFSLKTHIEPEYIPKLQKWIEKHKFKCVETIDDVKL